MSSTPVILILGAGPRVGASVAQKFASIGYKVAIASRKGTDSKTNEGFLSLKADFTKPDSVSALFDKVKSEYNVAPSVVVYNAATLTPPPDKESVLSISSDSVANDLAVNTISPYVAAQQAVKGFATLPGDIKKTFIYTGNGLNETVLPVPMMLTLGIGKSASAYWIGAVDMIGGDKGYR
jgi:NAD(P)-dependent dehydrogenase (short-subunit alcohol dehydrogenase family)